MANLRFPLHGAPTTSVLSGRAGLMNVAVDHPSFDAIEGIAAHCDECSGPWSRTIRTARSRTSGEYFVGRAVGSILSTNG